MSIESKLIYLLCKDICYLCDLLCVLCLSKHLGRPVQKPWCLNVMSVWVQIDQRVIMLIKEHFLSLKLRIVYFISEYIEQPFQALLYLGILGYLIKFCVSLKCMEQCVHCSLCENTILRKLIIWLWLELSCKCLEIATFVSTFLFYCMEKLQGQVQSFRITGSFVIGG